MTSAEPFENMHQILKGNGKNKKKDYHNGALHLVNNN